LHSHSPRPARGLKSTTRLEERLADEARFIKSWFGNPSLAGAVSPSGRFLARTMARYVDPHGSGPVVELGPGTGAITEALLQRGIAPSRLVLLEFDATFCALLRRRFPGVRVIQGDAYHLGESLRALLEQPAAAVVSSLPLLNKPERERLTLLSDAFGLLAPEGCFVQFTYGLASPVPRKNAKLTFHAEVSPPVWLNLPPARVWVYRPMTEPVQKPLPSQKPAIVFLGKLKMGTEKMHEDLKREIALAKARLCRPDKAHRPAARAAKPKPALDHDDVGLRQSNIMNVIDSKKLERDASGKPLRTFPHPARALLRKFPDFDKLRRP
jgi:phosphatidylethanolamine/phosphatidyl-N-methylethanolamine N-methyltransferase